MRTRSDARNQIWNSVRTSLLVLVGLTSLMVTAPRAIAAEETVDYPLVIFNVASVQRLRDNANYMFEIAERPEMIDRVDRWFVNSLKELKGIDLQRPYGLMLYMPPGFFGAPIGITYVPINNLDDAVQTLAFGQGTVTPVEGKKGYHTIRYGESFQIRTRQIGGYLFLVGPDGDDETLEKIFPDPIKLTSRMSSQYDAAISLQIKNVPPTTRQLFLEFVKNSSQAELQQRDGEPESSYRLRRANGENWLEFVEKVVIQGEEFTIGGRMDPATRKSNIDLEIAGTSDSKLAKFFQDMAGKRSYFGNLMANPSTLTMSISWLMSEKQRPQLVNFFEAARKEIAAGSKNGKTEGLSAVVDPVFKALIATAEVGHFDFFAQITGTEPGQFGLLAGTRLTASRSFPSQFSDLLQFAKDNLNENDVVSKLEIGSSEIDSLPVHRLEVSPPDKPGQRMFGETAHLHLYATQHALWFAFGGDSALQVLEEGLAQVAAPQDPQQARNRIPFMLVTHAKNWLSVGDDENPRAVALNEQASAAFNSENDSLQITMRPTDNGVRIRAEFEEGYVALLGRGIAIGDDSGVFSRPFGGGRRRARQRDEDVKPPANPGK